MVAVPRNRIGLDDGRLFVALDFFGDGLYEIDPDLQAPPRAIVPNVPGEYPLGFLNGFQFGTDGRLYAPVLTQNMVVSIDVDSCSNTRSPWTDCDIRPIVTNVCPASVGRVNVRGSPSTATRPAAKYAPSPKGAPVRRWQSMQ